MPNEYNSGETNAPIKPQRNHLWFRLIRYLKSKHEERRARKQAENATDKAVRQTAWATIWMAIFTAILAGTSGITIYLLITGGNDTHELAVQAKAQADKMRTVSEAAEKIRQAAEDMVKQDQRIADNARDTLNATNRQSKLSLDATIRQFHEEQRAWVGVIDVATEGGKVEGDAFEFRSLRIVVQNSGKTPALKMSIECCMYVPRPWSDAAIPDYDTEVTKQREATAVRVNEQIRQRPETATRIAQFEKETEEARKKYVHEGTLSPGAIITIQLMAGGMSQGGIEMTPEKLPSDPNAIPVYLEKLRQTPKHFYAIGKIAYSDIFPDTSEHTTTICLVREPGAQSVAFSICPQGRMD